MSSEAKMVVSDLVPWDKNPRKNDLAASKLAKHIDDSGWGAPILVQAGTNRIIAGHTRKKAAEILGLEEVPVRILDVDDRTATKLALADNKLGEVADWNNGILSQVLSDFSLDDVDLLGWDDFELGKLADIVDDFGPLETSPIDQDDVPELPEEATTRPGDVWRLGRHTLTCGDSMQWSPPATGDMLLTDPPYGVSYVGGNSDPRRSDYKSGGKVHNGSTTEVAVSILKKSFDHIRPGAIIFVTGPAGPPARDFIDCLCDLGAMRQMMVWVKNNSVFGRSDYHYRHEMIFFGWKPGAAHRKQKNRRLDTVWEYNRPSRSAEHPTMKPVDFWCDAIKRNSDRGDVIVDPFCGSGTTVVAAEMEGRVAHCCELSPEYCDFIVDRWQTLTGEQAVLEE